MPRDTDDEPIRRHSKRQNPWLIPAVAGGVAFLLLCGILTTLLFMSGGSSRSGDGGVGLPAVLGGEPTAEREGVEWTTKQMAAHLKARGLITEHEVTTGYIDAKTPSGGRVEVRKHYGKITAEDHARGFDFDLRTGHIKSDCPSFQWGTFTCTSHSLTDDAATAVFGRMKGAMVFTPSYRRGQESGPKKVNP